MNRKMRTALLMSPRFKKNCFGDNEMKKLADIVEICADISTDMSQENMTRAIEESELIITSWETPQLTADMIPAMSDLKLVCHCAGSVKFVYAPEVLDFFRKNNVKVMTTSYALGIGVAEFTLGMIIAGLKKTFFMRDKIAAGQWKEMQGRWFDQENDALLPVEPYDIKVGVIGAGCCGTHIIKLLSNFEMDILVYDPWKTPEQCAEVGAAKAELDEIMRSCDVITLHAPGLPETNGMINAKLIKMIKDGALFVNTARGYEVDEKVLIDELQTGRFFACLDQTITQPAELDNPLRKMPNVMLTPHIAGHVNNGFRRQGRHVLQDIERFNAEEPLKYELKLERLNILE